MKQILTRLLGVGAIGCVFALTSCVHPYAGPNERQGAVLGAAGGALLGGVIGNQSRRGLEGAAIGGILGSLAGQQIGASRDQQFFVRGGGGRGLIGRGHPLAYRGIRHTPLVYRSSFVRPGIGGSPFLGSRFGGFGGLGGFGGFGGFNRGIGGYCW